MPRFSQNQLFPLPGPHSLQAQWEGSRSITWITRGGDIKWNIISVLMIHQHSTHSGKWPHPAALCRCSKGVETVLSSVACHKGAVVCWTSHSLSVLIRISLKELNQCNSVLSSPKPWGWPKRIPRLMVLKADERLRRTRMVALCQSCSQHRSSTNATYAVPFPGPESWLEGIQVICFLQAPLEMPINHLFYHLP